MALAAHKGWRIYTHAVALGEDGRALEALIRATPDDEAALTELAAQLEATRRDAHALHEEAGLLLPLAQHLEWLPRYGSDIAAAEHLLETTIALTDALNETLAALKPLYASRANIQALDLSPELLAQVSAARPRFVRARDSVAAARASLANVPLNDLSPPLRARLERVEALLPALAAGLELGLAAETSAQALVPVAQQAAHTDTLTASLALADTLTAARPQVEEAQQSLAQARAAWDEVSIDDLPAALQPRAQQVEALLAVLDDALTLTLAAGDTAVALAPVLAERNPGDGPITAQILPRLEQARPHIIQTRRALSRLVHHLEQPALRELTVTLPLDSALIQDMVEEAKRAQALLGLALAAPNLLGADSPRSYLLVAQNPDELRATGGFISAAGVLTIEQGRVTDFFIENSPFVDRQRLLEGPYVKSPPPLDRYMGIKQWAFRDANWSPDFPTSATTALFLHNLSQGTLLHHVIAFDTVALQIILEATGPLRVEGSPTPVSVTNVFSYMINQYDSSREQGTDRKAFMSPLMEAIIERVQHPTNSAETFRFGKALLRALNERHLLLYSAQATTANHLARLEWDGAVQPPAHDFLMVVDANVGYSKANTYIHQALTYTVDLRNLATPNAELTIRHHHTYQPAALAPCEHWREFHRHIAEAHRNTPGYFLSYEEMARRCYWDYMRVLVPAGSRLTTADTQPVPAEWQLAELDDGQVHQAENETGTTALSTFLIVPPGTARETTLRYALPAGIISTEAQGYIYALEIQKQPGREPISIQVQILLPSLASLHTSSPLCQEQLSPALTCLFSLARDQHIEVRFQPGETGEHTMLP